MRYLVSLIFIVTLFFGAAATVIASDYDPLRERDMGETKTLYLDVTDVTRDRLIPLKVYLPSARSAEPVVLFSHGLGGDREGASYLGKHWSARGYVSIAIQHPGSDSSIWKNKPVGQRQSALKEAATPRNFFARTEDIKVVIDQLSNWSRQPSHQLFGRLDLDHVGMSGHSFGALTTQAVSGQRSGRLAQSRTDPRIKAAVVMSPSTPRWGDAATAFGSVRIPWLLMTGTQDVSRLSEQTTGSRRAVYPALPPGGKYELVLHDAEHSAFTDHRLPGDTQPRNPNHHRVILGLTTAFWDAYLRADVDAKTWLMGRGSRDILEPQDQFQMK